MVYWDVLNNNYILCEPADYSSPVFRVTVILMLV